MSLYTHTSSESKNDIIYMSTSKNSYPYKVYSNMRQEFWSHQFKMKIQKSKPKRLFSKIIYDTDSRLFNSSLETTNGMENISNSSLSINENKIQVEKLLTKGSLNTGKNNEDGFSNININPSTNDIPMSVDMSTQFNSDMKIIVEQDSKDRNIINIKFAGPFTGFMSGTGAMSHSKFLSLMNESRPENIKNTKSISHVDSKSIEEPPQRIKPKTSKDKSQQSIPSEESVDFFATVKPVDPLITDSNTFPDMTIPLNIKTSSLSNGRKSDSMNPFTTFEKTSGTIVQYGEPFSEVIGPTWLPSISFYSTNKSFHNVPAVLPRCIIKRIVRSMLTDLSLPKPKVYTSSSFELKIPKLTTNPEILNCNWNAAIIRGRIMIGELIELILSVNVDKVVSSAEGMEAVLTELKTEFVDCCVYLSKLIDASKIKDLICLELLIDIMIDEIKRLPEQFTEWMKGDKKLPFSAFFINNLRKEIYPNASETLSVTEPNTISKKSEKVVSEPSVDNQTKSNQSLSRQKRRQKMNDSTQENTFSENQVAPKPHRIYPDPSIITNSRVKKTMTTIFQSAIRQNVENQIISRESRNQIFPIRFIDYRPMVSENRDVSVIKELIQQNQLWDIPIQAGENSIYDLIEFIINTLSQDRETTKELYKEIEGELETLEEELIISAAKNLHISRQSNDDLTSLCYEILVEIIFKSMALAKYLFHSLESTDIDSQLLGQLFRNYILENSKPNEIETSNANRGSGKSSKYAHLTSEIMNYKGQVGNITLKTQKSQSESSVQGTNRKRPEISHKESSEKYQLKVDNLSAKQSMNSQDPKLDYLNSAQYLLTSGRSLSNDQNLPFTSNMDDKDDQDLVDRILLATQRPLEMTHNQDSENKVPKSSKLPMDSQDPKPKPVISKNKLSASNNTDPNLMSKNHALIDEKSLDRKAQIRENVENSRTTDTKVLTEHDSLVQKDSSERSANKRTDSSTQMVISEYQNQGILDKTKKPIKVNNSNEKLDSEYAGLSEENKQLLVIFNKLVGQTLEINKIKETLHILSESVNEKLANWTCKVPVIENEANSGDKQQVVSFAKSTNLFNIQEIVEPPKEIFESIQPTEHPFGSESNLRAVRDEKKSFIAPISNEMSEQRLRTPKELPPNSDGNIVDLDIMNLIVEGSHNFLISKQIRTNQFQNLERQDSCEPINTEFDKIFKWVIERYEETLESMKINSANKKIVEALKNSSFEEKRSIERELIKRIVDQNNLIINNWVKDICFHKVLKCLS